MTDRLRLDAASLAATERLMHVAAQRTAQNALGVARFESVTGIADVTHDFLTHIAQSMRHLSAAAEQAAAAVQTITCEGSACDEALAAAVLSALPRE
ncbi:MAG: hypothetical protein GX862_07155 [Leucobacter sp.]|nr:hypothetical protein [Leucobacter sp.]